MGHSHTIRTSLCSDKVGKEKYKYIWLFLCDGMYLFVVGRIQNIYIIIVALLEYMYSII